MTALHVEVLVEVLVEEPSMEAALYALLPKMLGETSFQIYVHNGKADLLASLPGRLRKIEVARAIAEHMDPSRNRSRSFCVLRDALTELVA